MSDDWEHASHEAQAQSESGEPFTVSELSSWPLDELERYHDMISDHSTQVWHLLKVRRKLDLEGKPNGVRSFYMKPDIDYSIPEYK